MNAAVPAIIVGGVLYLATKDGGYTPPRPTGIPYSPSPGSPTNPTNPASQQGQTYGNPKLTNLANILAGQQVTNYAGYQPDRSNWPKPGIDPALQQKLDVVQQAAQEKFNSMSSAAKTEAAQYLNKELNIQPPLKGDETWEVISKAVGSAAGAAGGTIAGTKICGPSCGKVGAMAGAYLGEKAGEWLHKELPELKDWLKTKLGNAWGEIEDFFSNVF